MKKLRMMVIALALVTTLVRAQDDNSSDFDFDSLFDDPAALEISEADTSTSVDSVLFAGPSFSWSGNLDSTAGVRLSWEDASSIQEDFDDPSQSLELDLSARLSFDARPDRNYRVFGSFDIAYPLSPQYASESTISLFELFTDFNWNEKAFFRFGKQTSSWGLSRFYQIADPLSVGIKDPENPQEDLEGPLALKITVPVRSHTLYVYGIVKDSWIPEQGTMNLADVGYGVKADIHVVVPDNFLVANGELTLGAFSQRRLAPKFVAGYSTAVWKVQVFSDQVLSYGLDQARLRDDGSVMKEENTWFYSATAGALYMDTERDFTAYAEYLYQSASSSDAEYYEKWYESLSLPGNQLDPVALFRDYLSRHNSALSVSWTDILKDEKLAASILWMQNWVDYSGLLRPTLTFTPVKRLSFETGLSYAWGGDRTEWVLKTSSLDSSTFSVSPSRLGVHLVCTLGAGSF